MVELVVFSILMMSCCRLSNVGDMVAKNGGGSNGGGNGIGSGGGGR